MGNPKILHDRLSHQHRENIRRFFINNGHCYKHPKGQIIISEEEPIQKAYLLFDGFMKMYNIDDSGSIKVQSLFGPHHIFPIGWILNEVLKHSPYYYEAFTDIEFYSIEQDKLYEFVFQDKDSIKDLIDLTVAGYFNKSSRVANLLKSNISDRVEYALYYISARIGEVDSNQIAKIKAHITHQDIADFAGLSRPSVSLELESLKHRGVISYRNGITTINLNKIDQTKYPKILPD